MFYLAYNLNLRSDIPLPELLPGGDGSDVDIRLAAPGPVVGDRRLEWRDSPRPQADMRFPGAGRFEVDHGRRVRVTPEPGADPALLRLYIQGMMLAAILHQRGNFVLHSSVVNLGGAAVAFIGPVGAGKSSTAAALYARGHAIIADDNAAIDPRPAQPTVTPAFAALKLYPDIAASLGYDRSGLKPMHGSQHKQAQPVNQGFSSRPVPLAAVYVLDREAPPEITRLTAVESITELIRHSVPARWGATGDGTHLRTCAHLVKTIPLYRIRTFTELDQLPVMADRIEAHQGRVREVAHA